MPFFCVCQHFSPGLFYFPLPLAALCGQSTRTYFFHFAPDFLFFPLLSLPLFDILNFTIKNIFLSVYPEVVEDGPRAVFLVPPRSFCGRPAAGQAGQEVIMSQSNPSALEQLPEGAIQLCQGRIHAFNRAAGAQFPELAVGGQPPAFLAPALGEQSAGVFLHQGIEYVFSRTPQDSCQLLLVHPSGQSALTDRQLDGFMREMRSLMHQMPLPVDLLSNDLVQAGGDPTDRLAAFQKTYLCMFRLMSHLECLRQLNSPQFFFRPITLDLAGLCAHVSAEAASQLEGAGVTLTYRCTLGSLLMPGDPTLLTTLVMNLVSNAAKAAKATPQGTVFLTLAQRRDRAILSVTDSSQDFAQEDLEALFPSPMPDDHIPDPQEGAGMGLAIARRIVALHKGAMLLERRESGSLLSVVSLPTGPLNPRLDVRSPRIEDTGGYSPVLVELADVLPQAMFRFEDDD